MSLSLILVIIVTIVIVNSSAAPGRLVAGVPDGSPLVEAGVRALGKEAEVRVGAEAALNERY